MNSGDVRRPVGTRVIRGEADDPPGLRRGPGALHELIERRDRARRSAPAIVAIVASFGGYPSCGAARGHAWAAGAGRRISVTDRCNFRCVYCMPKEVFGRDYPFLPREELLTFEEIERVACAFAGLGVEKIRITGGEPLVRRDLETLVGLLARIDGLDLTLTTNGALLARKAVGLREAGLNASRSASTRWTTTSSAP